MYCARSLYNVATCHGMSNLGFSPSSSTSPIKGEGTLTRHCEERSDVAIY